MKKSLLINNWLGSACKRLAAFTAAVSLALIAAGCCHPVKSVASIPCVNVDATVAYYYRYKDATPDQSDIAFVEWVSSGPRCIQISSKKAPVFPDGAISAYVTGGSMLIDSPPGKNVDVSGKADIAVYYRSDPSTPKLSMVPVGVENLSGVSRTIETVNVKPPGNGSPACGMCAQVPCDGYLCCKRPPCP